MDNKLKLAREKINEIDTEMAKLFVERLKASEMVAEYKKEHGLEILDPIREAEVIRRNSESVENDVYREYYVNFQKNTMSLSRSYQARILEGMTVAYSGTEGAYAHLAARKLFPTAKTVACASFDEAYLKVEAGECDAAVLPIENSYNGEVGQVTDLMFFGSLYVSEMMDLAVSHDLLALPGTRIEDVREVVSHPQAIAQCAEYIRNNGWSTAEYSNTALAAKYVAEKQDKTVVAIASEEAAEVFGLEVLARNINASRNNTTRFASFSRIENRHHSHRLGEHFVLLFTVKHEAGALAKALDIIGRYGFNMRTLRSRPTKDFLWQYYFYVEAEGNIYTEAGERMLRELGSFCDRLKLAGTYFDEER